MHRTGKYRTLTLICGILPFISTVMISLMNERSHPLLLWLGIVSDASPYSDFLVLLRLMDQFPLGFGNAVVLQTMLSTSSYIFILSSPLTSLPSCSALAYTW